MSGYSGYSMSNNAVDAYNNGEKPISKWTKADILDEVSACGYNFPLLKKVKVSVLKSKLLWKSGWHHTSKQYNKTDFYSIDRNALEELNDEIIETWISESAACESKKEATVERWECAYLVWSGTRKHPKAEEQTAVGEIRGDWFYLPDGRKKSVHGNGFRKIRKVC